MEDNEAKVIDEAIKFIKGYQWPQYRGGIHETPSPAALEEAVREYLTDNGETLETY
jgi:hypothetical protein